MRVIRDFAYRGYKFHINDNRTGISNANYNLFPRYNLLLYAGDKWINIGCANTKRDCKAIAMRYYLDVLQYDLNQPGE